MLQMELQCLQKMNRIPRFKSGKVINLVDNKMKKYKLNYWLSEIWSVLFWHLKKKMKVILIFIIIFKSEIFITRGVPLPSSDSETLHFETNLGNNTNLVIQKFHQKKYFFLIALSRIFQNFRSWTFGTKMAKIWSLFQTFWN